MGRIPKRTDGIPMSREMLRKLRIRVLRFGALLAGAALLCAGCGKEPAADAWLEAAALDARETPEELYEKALSEDVLIVYTVTSRAAQVKEAFEAAYPGLYVEIRDLRSPSLVDAVEENFNNGGSDCDIAICNDNSGEFKTRLVDTGIVLPYLPNDIGQHMKEGTGDGMVHFVYEAEMMFYNSAKYDAPPVDNLWALTDPVYEGRIYMSNPLRSFSTYALCGASLSQEEAFRAAYDSYEGTKPALEEGGSAAESFWKAAAKNMVFTNSSDEVVEALNNGSADLGFMVSSKLRLKDTGYTMEPVWNCTPFNGCRTSYAVMIARNSRNVNAAKLFVRFLLGESDGRGKGYEPFCTPGTWSARDDVPDANPVSMGEMDLIWPDPDQLVDKHDDMEKLWTEILRENAGGTAGENNTEEK